MAFVSVSNQGSLKMKYIWFKVLYKYGSVTSVQIYRSYFFKRRGNQFYVKKKNKKTWRKINKQTKGWGWGVNLATALVFTVMPAKSKILTSIIQFDWVYRLITSTRCFNKCLYLCTNMTYFPYNNCIWKRLFQQNVLQCKYNILWCHD